MNLHELHYRPSDMLNDTDCPYPYWHVILSAYKFKLHNDHVEMFSHIFDAVQHERQDEYNELIEKLLSLGD